METEAGFEDNEVYEELRRLAHRLFAGENASHTDTPTGVLHLAWERSRARSLQELKSTIAPVFRRLLIEHARKKARGKRGGDRNRVDMGEDELPHAGFATPFAVELNEAFERLESLAPQAAKVAELRFFGKMTNLEIAAHLGISERLVVDECRLARAVLGKSLMDG